MKVCVTEKPSVARDIASILGADVRRDGYFEGNGYKVTWTFGHLCTLKEPADYTEYWKRWSLGALPMLPAKFGIKLIPVESYERQFNVIKSLIADADASVIGSEGPGLLLLTARVTSADDTALERAHILLVDEARRLAEPGEISPSELERTLNNFEATFRFSNTGYLARASNLAQAELHGEDINATVTDRRRLTVAGLQRTAARIFLDTPSATVIYK